MNEQFAIIHSSLGPKWHPNFFFFFFFTCTSEKGENCISIFLPISAEQHIDFIKKKKNPTALFIHSFDLHFIYNAINQI